MTDTNLNHVQITVSNPDPSNIETVDSHNCSQSVEMRIDNSYLNEQQRLKILFRCRVSDVWKTDECKELMNFMRRFSSSLLADKSCIDISDVADNDNCIEFFRSYVIICTENCSQMIKNISQREYINLIKFVMALWNMSDKFDSLCTRMVSFEVHVYLIRLLGKMQVTASLLEVKHILLLVMSIVGILHNINRKLNYTRSRYRNENLVKYLMPLTALDTSKDLIALKTAALLLLAFLVNENENSILNAKDDHIIYILNILKASLETSEFYSRDYGYHCLEILHSLRHIASPDSNKRSLVNNGALSLIGLVLEAENEEKYPEEVVAALEFLWSLSFSKECVLVLNADGCELKSRVEELAQNTNMNIVLSARGILWNINNAQRSLSLSNLIRNDSKTPNIGGHIMVSYQHSTQEVMVKIKNKLINSGYRVWMDVDYMKGSFVDAMAEGIQHAAVLLLGMCQAFKNSPHCRQEVKYAYTLGIPLVPIMLEPGFTPDGWLGLMCATLIYTEFIEPEKFDLNMIQLQRQLGKLGHSTNSQLSNQDSLDGSCPISNHQQPDLQSQESVIIPHHSSYPNKSVSESAEIVISFKSDHSCMNNLQSYISEISSEDPHLSSLDSKDSKRITDNCCMCKQPELQVLLWSHAQVKAWLLDHSIPVDIYGYPLSAMDGPLLLELADMRINAPEMFYRCAKEDMKLEFLHVLHLSRALRGLKNLT